MKRGAPSIADAAALAVLFAAHRRHGTKRFRVNMEGANAAPLQHAASRGWAWWATPDTCAITDDGVRQLADYGVRADAEV